MTKVFIFFLKTVSCYDTQTVHHFYGETISKLTDESSMMLMLVVATPEILSASFSGIA